MSCQRYLYAAGKIKKGHGATEYRATIAPKLRAAGIHMLDPLRGKYDQSKWDTISPIEIVVRDLQDIDRSHVVLAVQMQCKDSSFGTPCEVMYAWLQRTPVVLVTDEEYLAGHPWVKALCAHIFLVKPGSPYHITLEKAVNHICNWYGPNVEQEVYNGPKITNTGSAEIKGTAHVAPADVTPLPVFIEGNTPEARDSAWPVCVQGKLAETECVCDKQCQGCGNAHKNCVCCRGCGHAYEDCTCHMP